MAQYSETESIGRRGSIVLGILEVQAKPSTGIGFRLALLYFVPRAATVKVDWMYLESQWPVILIGLGVKYSNPGTPSSLKSTIP